MPQSKLNNDPLWFKDAIIYEVPVRAYCDSNGDGIGDFAGLTEKLDYLEELGITAIWILPFFPSPLRDDGYDISDYRDVNSIYGNLDDFKTFLDAAHERGIRVIIELVVNHTSDQHPWFQRARRLPKGSKEREFYVWSDTPEKYPEVRIIFQDFETSNWAWDPVAKAYYWHRFYSHQPDLNYESPELQQAVLELADFWLGMGVDGMRLDAVPYLCVREGTNCENLPETHAFLKRLRAYIDSKYEDRMLLAEANQWPEDAAAYYGEGDECQMNFHFPLMPRLFMALRMEDSFPIVDILNQTPSIPNNCQWALFLRNHDELTLEMVTDEDRDYMYRVYAEDTQARLNLGIRRRLAPLLGNDRRQIELMNSLLLSLPGTPVLYYGDEIGMGDNIYIGDRNGVRTPMQWSPDRNAGFSRANPQKLYQPVILDSEYHYEAINVEAQSANPNSLLSWMKRLIAMRKRFQAFGRGTFELLHPENRKVLAFVRTYSGEHILVVANLSRFVQSVELDLTPFQGMVPVEIFGRNQFPKIGESSYFLSIAPYGFYWFMLQFDPATSLLPRPRHQLPALEVAKSWHQIFSQSDTRERLESLFPEYLHRSSWFISKSRVMQSVTIADFIPIPFPKQEAAIVMLNVDYTEGFAETYVVLLSCAIGEQSKEVSANFPSAVLASVKIDDQEGILFEASADQDFLTLPLDMIRNRQQYKGKHGTLTATTTDALAGVDMSQEKLNPQLMGKTDKNALVVYGDRLIFKFFRRVEPGINPELEIRSFLGQKQQLEHIAPVMGGLKYQPRRGESTTLGVLQVYIPDGIKAWNYTLDNLRDFFDRITLPTTETPVEVPSESLLTLKNEEIPEEVGMVIGSYLSNIQLLGQRTAELHIALSSDTDDPNFTPEPFSSLYQRSIYQYSRNLTGQVMLKLRKGLGSMKPETQELAKKVLSKHEYILGRFQSLLNLKITGLRTRCHGDYSLEEILYTGKDFWVIDFEGETYRTLNERRMKRSPLRDVAAMLQSLNYATRVALLNEVENGMIRPENVPEMEQWAKIWYNWVGAKFLGSYLEVAKEDGFLPKTKQELQVLLDSYLLERIIQSLDFHYNRNQQLIDIPLQQLLEVVV